MDSPHWQHGRRSIATREALQGIGESFAEMKRRLNADRVNMTLSMLGDLGARIAMLEHAVFGEERGWFELTPEPGDRLLASFNPMHWGEVRRGERDAEPDAGAGDDAAD